MHIAHICTYCTDMYIKYLYFLLIVCCLCLSGTAALEEDAQILKVIEAYCTSAKTRQTLNSSEETYTHIHTHLHTVLLTNHCFFAVNSNNVSFLFMSSLYPFAFHFLTHTKHFLLNLVQISYLPLSPPTFVQTPIHCYGPAWQGTDLMHNHVLADSSLTVAGFPGNLPCSDQSEDSDYDSIWTATSYRTASFSRKILGL